MTSEVVVMNRMGIALAADSVVSIYANGIQKKRHDSVAKLFHDVGAAPSRNNGLQLCLSIGRAVGNHNQAFPQATRTR